MALTIATALRNARADAVTTFAGANAQIRIYTGTMPANNGALSGNTLLGTLTCSATLAPAAVNGVLTFNAITQDSAADATGTATWFRVVKSDGTTIAFDGTVGTSGADLNLNSVSITVGGPIQVTSATWSEAV